jgi:hypothetical protein
MQMSGLPELFANEEALNSAMLSWIRKYLLLNQCTTLETLSLGF